MLPAPESVDAAVVYEPVFTQLMSLTMLVDSERYDGLDDWVLKVTNQMSAEIHNQHRLLFSWFWMDSLVNVVERGEATQSFNAYISAIEAYNPIMLRNKLFEQMTHSTHTAVGSDYRLIPEEESLNLLHNLDAFTTTFKEVARKKFIANNIESFHNLLNNPQQLQETLVTQLRYIWTNFLEAEWRRVEPRILRSVKAFQSVQLNDLTMLEAIQLVTGRDLRPAFRLERLLTFKKVRFVPHVHNGPYIIWFGHGDTFYIGFPAREPSLSATNPTFDQATFVNRCKGLADGTRLSILLALAETGGMSTAEIIERFSLDKSAASRHLRHLVATSLIEERRVDKAKKAYHLNATAIEEVATALKQLLP